MFIEALAAEIEARDQKYSKLMEKLREVQKENKEKDHDIAKFRSTTIPKIQCEAEMEQIRSENQEMQIKIKKLLQQTEKNRIEEEKLRHKVETLVSIKSSL